MIDFKKGTEQMDHPEILCRLFFPCKGSVEGLRLPNVLSPLFEVEEGVSIGCRFYPIQKDGPNILYFHGNGETCLDYDYIAPLYWQRGINLFVADYRGYGYSGGRPTCSSMVNDAHPTFHGFVTLLRDQEYTGDLFVMGRSLGSAPALEVAYYYHEKLKGLIVESGFAVARNQFGRLGALHLLKEGEEPVGFGNDLKIKEVTIPTLIIHGEEDEIIPSTEGRALYALSGASEKVSLFVPNAGHNDLMMLATNEYMTAIEKFTKRQ
ncbi:MAG: alpha/beta hydrolase [Proteobacteria bacterium]|nr:alpha/beta hydrolase [Pseudomonadota bacterium]